MDRNPRTSVYGAIGLAAIVASAAVLASLLRRRRTHTLDTELEVAPVIDNVSHDETRHGTPADRGRTPAFALDVEQLRTAPEFTPAVEYLTFIQSKRGSGAHLLFVRFEDLDAIAALEGASVPDFMERLDHLGVVVSNN